jgi:alpha/beta superfamily hydrolase
MSIFMSGLKSLTKTGEIVPEVIFNGPSGRLEGRYQPAQDKNAPIAMILHPHPKFGGTMSNQIVYDLFYMFRNRGFTTFRFNFRGVGRSQGAFDHGHGELSDAAAALDWVQSLHPDSRGCWIAGFSFGSYIVARAAKNLQLGQLITIAPPVDRYKFSQLRRPNCPWLVVQGDEDEVVALEDVTCWIKDVDPPPEFVVMEQAGHFFHRRLMDLRGLLKNGVRPNLPEKTLS